MIHTQSFSLMPRNGHSAPFIEVRHSLPSQVAAISPFADQLMRFILKFRSSDGSEPDIEMAVREALANAVIHGAKEDPTKTVECLVSNDDERGILIIVRDPGTGFTTNAIPTCTVGENLFSNHGRGIFLINQLMDKVEFRRNGTEIHMVKR